VPRVDQKCTIHHICDCLGRRFELLMNVVEAARKCAWPADYGEWYALMNTVGEYNELMTRLGPPSPADSPSAAQTPEPRPDGE